MFLRFLIITYYINTHMFLGLLMTCKGDLFYFTYQFIWVIFLSLIYYYISVVYNDGLSKYNFLYYKHWLLTITHRYFYFGNVKMFYFIQFCYFIYLFYLWLHVILWIIIFFDIVSFDTVFKYLYLTFKYLAECQYSLLDQY